MNADAIESLAPHAGEPTPDPIDWSESRIAQLYPRSQGFLHLRSPDQKGRPSSKPGGKRMATNREVAVKW